MSLMKKVALIGFLGVFCAECAMALDANDIVNLKKHGVQDSTIINMVRANKLPRPLTSREVVFLNGNGISAPLLEFLTRPEASAIQPVSVPQAATPVACPPPQPMAAPVAVATGSACAPTPVYVQTPTYVVQSAPTYVVAPRYGYRPYYRSYGGPYQFGFHYGRGGRWHRRGYRGGWGRW